MTEVNLAKRLLLFAVLVLVALSAMACTRDKPEPVPATVVSPATAGTPATSPTLVGLVSPTPALSLPTIALTTTVNPLPTSVPIPTMTPPASSSSAASSTTSTAPSSAPGTYTVKWGDWLNKIAAENGTTVQAILAVNPGLNPNRIYPGQVINLPGGGTSTSSASSSASSSATSSEMPPSSGGPSTYTVQRGDWIYAIARRFGISVPALLAANPGINPNFVFPGQVLNIPSAGTTPPGGNPSPNPGTYTVQPGDTLFSIAVRFRTTIYALQIKNNLANPNFLYPGQVLTIPQ